ncbi:MAG: 50S ribosomal protein L20 [Candidatus Dormibacteria bacterium]
MARVKRGVTGRARHKKIRELAQGYTGAQHRLFRATNEAVMHAGQYAYRDRKHRKSEFRRLWISRINAAVRQEGLSYSEFMYLLQKKAGVEVNRKVLSSLAIDDPSAFNAFVAMAKAQQNAS